MALPWRCLLSNKCPPPPPPPRKLLERWVLSQDSILAGTLCPLKQFIAYSKALGVYLEKCHMFVFGMQSFRELRESCQSHTFSYRKAPKVVFDMIWQYKQYFHGVKYTELCHVIFGYVLYKMATLDMNECTKIKVLYLIILVYYLERVRTIDFWS